MNGVEKNIHWINTGRALCMLFVYIAHCNFYYLNHFSFFYFVYKPFYLSFFFFLSGYLFFRNFSYKKRLKNLCNKLLWPVILFPSFIWLPKAFAHGNDISVVDYVIDIFGGTAAWFVSTLIVVQLLAVVLMFLLRRNLWKMLVAGIVLMLSAFWLAKVDTTPFPWYYKSGMVAIFFFVLGGLAQKYYEVIKKYISVKYLIVSAVVYIGIMLYNYCCLGYMQAIMSVKYDCIPFGVLCNILGILFMFQLCHYIPSVKWLQYMGKNSIVFYFLAGGIPLVIGALTKQYILVQGYVITFMLTVVCVAMVFPVCYIINRYFPWILDFSKITNALKSIK